MILKVAYGKDYTLSTMPTQAYVMDERFHDHGACVAINDGPIKWFTHELLPKVLPALHAKYPNAIWVAHNWLFDGTILSLRYGIRPILIVDTASMSRAIIGPWLRKHDLDGLAQLLLNRGKGKELRLSYNIKYLPADIETKIATYCALDVDLMREALRIMAPHFPACELSVMTWVSQMMTQPTLHFDEQMLRDYHESVVSRKTQLLFDLQIDRKDLMSNDKFAVLLDRYGVDPPTKWTKPSKKFPGGRITWAFAKTDKGLKDLLEHDSPDVQALVAARMQVKSTIEETRSKKYLGLAHLNPICMPFRYSGAIPTHRLAGCLVASTKILCYNPARDSAPVEKAIVDVLPDDLVWDGVEFVSHEGVAFRGMREVISYDGIEGTSDHKVFTEQGTVSLERAKETGARLVEATKPTDRSLNGN